MPTASYNQLQWDRNTDDTVAYQVFRALSSGVSETDTKIMDLTQPSSGTYVVVSDKTGGAAAHDSLKTYLGPEPYDNLGPDTPTGIGLVKDDALNRATLSWNALAGDNGVNYYYRVRAIDDAGNFSDLSNEDEGLIISGLAADPYLVEASADGSTGWAQVSAQNTTSFVEQDIDVAGPDPVTDEASTVAGTATEGKVDITLDWTNPTKDNGTNSKHYRVRAVDANGNHSDYTAVQEAVEVVTGITHGTGGLEVKWRNATAEVLATPEEITFNTDEEDLANSLLIAGTVRVTNSAGTVDYVYGVDYDANLTDGKLIRIPTGSIAAEETVKVTYKYNDGTNAGDSDTTLVVGAITFDGTYFTGGLSGLESHDHADLDDQSAYNYRVRVQDNVGNWSTPVYLKVNAGDFTSPNAPTNLSATPQA